MNRGRNDLGRIEGGNQTSNPMSESCSWKHKSSSEPVREFGGPQQTTGRATKISLGVSNMYDSIGKQLLSDPLDY